MEKKKQNYYDDAFRLKVVSDYYASGLSKSETARKHGLPDHTSLCSWLKRFPLSSELVSLPKELKLELMAKNVPATTEEELKKRIKELEKALSYANLRAHALDVLIDVAEKNEGVQIRKKAGTKQ
jgi:transposase-like protein